MKLGFFFLLNFLYYYSIVFCNKEAHAVLDALQSVVYPHLLQTWDVLA